MKNIKLIFILFINSAITVMGVASNNSWLILVSLLLTAILLLSTKRESEVEDEE